MPDDFGDDMDRARAEGRLPSYNEMLNYLCERLQVPGSPTFKQAVEQVRRRLERAGEIEVTPP